MASQQHHSETTLFEDLPYPKPTLSARLAASLPGQKLQRQLQVVFQGPQLLDVAAKTDVVKEEAWTEFLWGRKHGYQNSTRTNFLQ